MVEAHIRLVEILSFSFSAGEIQTAVTRLWLNWSEHPPYKREVNGSSPFGRTISKEGAMINTKRLRCFIGWLAISLPWLVSVLVGEIPKSISAAYYDSRAIAPFMIILGASSIMLMFYDGYDKNDDILNTTAGIAGVLICLFPCYNDQYNTVGTFGIPPEISGMMHNISAVTFFAILAFVSFFQFTKTNGDMTAKKKARNVIYRVCGIGMIASFALFLLPDFYIKTWLIEMIALTFFGISWLTKANAYKWLFAE